MLSASIRLRIAEPTDPFAATRSTGASRTTDPPMRRLLLAIFQRINPGDITIKHHWTDDRLSLHSFQHKGYWFHGRNRKRKLMETFGQLIATGECVFDLGGHIGYTALYFSYLVGETGHVSVFEPSPESLSYLRRNVAACARNNIRVVEKAVSYETGHAVLYCESVTGQNSTIVPSLDVRSPIYKPRRIDTVRVDQFVEDSGMHPTFIKMDVEGAELQALCGMTRTLQTLAPRIAVEINLYGDRVWRLLDRVGYRIYDETGLPITSPDSVRVLSNLFAFHAKDQAGSEQFLKIVEQQQ